MKSKVTLGIRLLVLSVSSFSIQTSLATEKEKFKLEYCAVSQADKCKQTRTDCETKKICFWKDLGVITAIGASVAGTAAAVNSIAN